MFGISICIIAKNESKRIEKCLDAINLAFSSYADGDNRYEILVLDTGSEDDTISLSEKKGARVEHFDWVNDFSKARNAAMEKAEYDLILFIDADEYIETVDFNTVKELYNSYPDAIGRIKRRNECYSNGDNTCIFVDLVERLFSKHLYHYEGKIHEQVTHNLGKDLVGYETPIVIFHDGYLGNKEERLVKAKRNNELLLEELKTNPEDSYIYYQLAQSYSLCNDKEKQYEYNKLAYEYCDDKNLEYAKLVITNLGFGIIEYENYDSFDNYIENEMSNMSDSADFLCMAGSGYLKYKKFEKAIYMYNKALSAEKYDIEENKKYNPYNNLACIYEALGDELKAIDYFEKAEGGENSVAYKKLLELKALSREKLYQKKVSIVFLVDSSVNNIDKFFEIIKNQSIGIGHIEIVAVLVNAEKKERDAVFEFEKANEESVIIIDLSDEVNLTSELISNKSDYVYEIYNNIISLALSYTSSDKIMFVSGKENYNFDAVRLICVCMDNTKAQVVADGIVYDLGNGNTGDFLLTIANDNMRAAVKKLQILRKGISGKIYNIDFLMQYCNNYKALYEESLEENYAERIFCIKDKI